MGANATWMGNCLKCQCVLKSAHHSGVCKECRQEKCKKCSKSFRPSIKSGMTCSDCRNKKRTEEYRFNMNEEHFT